MLRTITPDELARRAVLVEQSPGHQDGRALLDRLRTLVKRPEVVQLRGRVAGRGRVDCSTSSEIPIDQPPDDPLTLDALRLKHLAQGDRVRVRGGLARVVRDGDVQGARRQLRQVVLRGHIRADVEDDRVRALAQEREEGGRRLDQADQVELDGIAHSGDVRRARVLVAVPEAVTWRVEVSKERQG